jgi:hypothetical protein
VTDSLARRFRAVSRLGYEPVLLAVLFVALSGLAALFPRTGDDWSWGSQVGIGRLHDWFRNYNGRYVGNLVILGLSRTTYLAAVVVGAGLAATIFLVVAVAQHRRPLGYAATVALLFAMPRAVWAEGVAWLSGYTNYGLAAVGMLGFGWLLRREWADRPPPRRRNLMVAAVVLQALVSALFMENVTMLLVAGSVAAAGLYRRRFGRWSVVLNAYAGGAVVGAVVMFSNGAYRAAAHGTALYQHLSPSALLEQRLAGFGSWLSGHVETDLVWLLVTVVAVAVVVVRGADRWLGVAAVALVLVAFGFSWVVDLAGRHGALAGVGWHRALGAAALVLLALAALAMARLAKDPTRRSWLTVDVIALLVLNAPLLVVSPVGPRCFYPSYVLGLVVVNRLLAGVRLSVGARWISAAPAVAVAVVAVVLFTSYAGIYHQIHHRADTRLAYIRARVAHGATKVHVRPLPHRGYVHEGNPFSLFLSLRYEQYYGIPTYVFILPPRRHAARAASRATGRA